MVEINGKQYKVWTWKHHSMLHYIINPGILINELILGQRVPKEIYFEQVKDKPFMERQYVKCPHCETMHDGRTWSSQHNTAFKNWFGLYCPSCEGVIPCLRNATAWLILAVTYPLWFWWIDKWKSNWLAKQPARYENIDVQEITVSKTNWVKAGLLYGSIMFILMTFLFPLVMGEAITIKSILIAIPIWVIAGLLCVLLLKWWMGKRIKPEVN